MIVLDMGLYIIAGVLSSSSCLGYGIMRTVLARFAFQADRRYQQKVVAGDAHR